MWDETIHECQAQDFPIIFCIRITYKQKISDNLYELLVRIIDLNLVSFVIKGGVEGHKSWKHNFEIAGDSKGPTRGSTFWLGFEVPDPYGYLWGHALSRPQKIENDNQCPKPEFFITNR